MNHLYFFILFLSTISLSQQQDSTCNDHGTLIYQSICLCDKGYETKDRDKPCNYKRKEQWLVFTLETVVAFGAGHFYAENYALAIPKLIFWILGWGLFIAMRVVSVKREKKDELALLLAMVSCLFTLGIIIWYITDVILIGLNRYDDGNGIHFLSWYHEVNEPALDD